MNIYLVDTSIECGQKDIQRQEGLVNFLLSYWYKRLEGDYKTLINNAKNDGIECKVIIDSGAFSAYNSGKTIDPKKYGEWALGLKKRWEREVDSLSFMNLDVIGDQQESWANQKKLEDQGLQAMPIITYGADLRHLTRALDDYEYIALGGLVGKGDIRIKGWLDACFSLVIDRFKATNVMPKIHLLGVTKEWALFRYPCYTCDSSGWVSCLRFGSGDAIGIKKVPRLNEKGGTEANRQTLRAEVRKYKKMQNDATNLWKKRGVKWEH